MPKRNQRTVTIAGIGAGRLILSEIANYASELGMNTPLMVLYDTHAGAVGMARLGTKGVLIGKEIFRGCGAYGDIEKCKIAALKERKKIGDALSGSKIVFVVTCLGGGTGSGIAPVVCDIARKQGAFVIAIATYPTVCIPKTWKKTRDNAKKGLEELRKYADILTIVNNEKIRRHMPKDCSGGDICTICNKIAARMVWNACQGKGVMRLFEK